MARDRTKAILDFSLFALPCRCPYMGVQNEAARDWELLQEYACRASEEAFAQIVRRYVDLVWSVCLRDLHDRHLAEDATQAVFLVLARKARTLKRGTVLAGWLFRTAQFVARDAVKQEARREARERRAAEMMQKTQSKESSWGELEPLLNEMLGELAGKDRDAILLHYMQGKTLAEVGAAMGTSEDAARMRIARAIESLRSRAVRKGLTVSAGAIVPLLAANAVQAAPAGLADSAIAVIGGSVGGAAAVGSTAAVLAQGAMKAMLDLKIKIAAVVLAATLLVPFVGVMTYRAVSAPPPTQPAQGADGLTVLPADFCRFRLENGRLTVGSNVKGDPNTFVNVKVAGLDGEATVLRYANGDLDIQLGQTGANGRVDTRIKQSAFGLQIQRSIVDETGRPCNLTLIHPDKQLNWKTSFREDMTLKPGEVAMLTDRNKAVDPTKDEADDWTADDLPSFAAKYPVHFGLYLRPLFRDLGATELLYTLPASVGRQVLIDHPKPGDQVKEQVQEIDKMRSDVNFLLECLECDAVDVRTAALARLREVSGKNLEFDVNAKADKLATAVCSLRVELRGATTKPAAK